MIYAELHCHSSFSFLLGASAPEDLVEQAARLGYSALALTDRDGLYGVVRFHEAARAHGIRPLFGSEVSFDDGTRLTLLARNAQGYANLSALITAGRRAREKGAAAAPVSLLPERARGLIALSGDPAGAVPAAILRRNGPAALRAADHLRQVFEPGCFFLELMNHHLPYEATLNEGLLQLARRLDLPLVATHDVVYAEASRRRLQDVMTCIRNHTHLAAAGTVLWPNGDFGLLSQEAALNRWASLPGAINNTRLITEMCELELSHLDFTLPGFPVPLPFRTPQDYLEHLTFLYAAERFDTLGPKQIKQLRHELTVIADAGLAGYFLIVWDLMRFCHERGIFAQGRGSAANSAVCFALGITNVDPIKLDLLFERFLSEGRDEPPDIDIDIANNRREEVIQYVYERYGRDHAGMVCEVICYRARSAVRDVAKALGLSPTEVDAVAKRVDGRTFRRGVTVEGLGALGGTDQSPPEEAELRADGVPSRPRAHPPAAPLHPPTPEPARTEDAAALEALGLGDLGEVTPGGAAAPREGEPADPDDDEARAPPSDTPADDDVVLDPHRVGLIFELAAQLEGSPRHLGIHVGGMILCGAALSERVPIENAAMADRTVIQWDKDDVAALKVPKIDLLGLGMLSLLSDCLRLIREHWGVSIDPARLPHDDPATWDMICRADTVGVFQIESRAQMNTLPRMKPRCFYDLVVEVALIRPGPLQGDMVHPYLRRRSGEEPVTYPHSDLEPVLARTLGVPLFQEQGMKVAITAAGFTPRQADELRRAMKSRRATRQMDELKTLLIQGMLARGYDPDITERVVKQIEAFSSYGFPESHAASFAFLVYLSAWLKCHYPAAFYCALLDNQPMGFYSPATIVADARRHGVQTLPVDLVASGWGWTLTRRRMLPGLKAVRGFGQTHWQSLAAAREARPFTSVWDVCDRSGLPKLLLERLAKAGAFRALEPDRRRALWEVQGFRRRPGLAAPPSVEGTPPLPRATEAEVLVQDLASVGYSAADHPLRHLKPTLDRWGVVGSGSLPRIHHGRRVRVAGLASVRQKPPTAKGFCFLTLEDTEGMINVVVAPDVYETYRPIVRRAMMMVVEGRLEKVEGVINIRAEKIGRIDERFSETLRSRDFH